MPGGNRQDPKNKETEAKPLPQSSYKVVDPDPDSPYHQFAETNSVFLANVAAAAEEEKPPVSRPTPQPNCKTWAERIEKFKENRLLVYGAAGLGLGVLLAILLGIVFWLTGPPNGRYDLGPVTSAASGLKGHLFIQWDKKLEYRLTLEPGDADQMAEFALAVANSPKPLSVQINLQDSMGFVLCSKDILLKYNAPDEQLSQALTELHNAQEAVREQGKDVFQNHAGPDGQITAINAQGDISCSAKAYEKAEAWSFTTDFPSLAEQSQLLRSQRENPAKEGRQSANEAAANKKTALKPAAKLLPFSVEGDDAVVDFDVARGTIETRGRKIFVVDRASAASSRWQDFPVAIHYRCDRSSNCTLMSGEAGVLRGRMAR